MGIRLAFISQSPARTSQNFRGVGHKKLNRTFTQRLAEPSRIGRPIAVVASIFFHRQGSTLRQKMRNRPNQSMKPTSPAGMTARVFATPPCRGLSFSLDLLPREYKTNEP